MARRGANPAENGGGMLQRADRGEPARPAPGEQSISEMRESISQLAAERDRLREELEKARAQIASLERLADEDALTTVANRRAFVRHLARMIAFANRYRLPASVVYFDVNNMKHINDVHGHAAGDAALRHVATVLGKNIRTSDVIGRLGGDEFGIILAHTEDEQANRKAAALAEAVAARPLRWGELEIPVSVAYGVYAFSGRDDPQRAIEAADRAMYQQKRAETASDT